MTTYRIRGTDGKVSGPVDGEVLRQWIAKARVTTSTFVQPDGGSEWKPLSSFPEFAAELPGGSAISPAPLASGPAKTSRLAVTALVCGILGFLCLPAVAGLVLGIVALVKISQSRGQLRGRGLAIAGVCISAFMLVAIIPAGLSQAKKKAMQINCLKNLEAIGLCARMYFNDNKDTFPPDFLSMSNELNSPKILVCPGDTQHTKASSWAAFVAKNNLTYEYLKPGIAASNAANEMIFRCPIHKIVVLGDGSVEQRPMTSAGRPLRTPQ